MSNNLFSGTPTYVTLAQVRESSTNTHIHQGNSVNDDELTVLIIKAEDIIDFVIGSYGEKLVENQTRIFPTINDGIPLNIKKATVLLVENLYTGGVLTGGAYESNLNGQVKSETYRGHTVSYFGTGDVNSQKNPFLNAEILGYLDEYLRSLNSNWYK